MDELSCQLLIIVVSGFPDWIKTFYYEFRTQTKWVNSVKDIFRDKLNKSLSLQQQISNFLGKWTVYTDVNLSIIGLWGRKSRRIFLELLFRKILRSCQCVKLWRLSVGVYQIQFKRISSFRNFSHFLWNFVWIQMAVLSTSSLQTFLRNISFKIWGKKIIKKKSRIKFWLCTNLWLELKLNNWEELIFFCFLQWLM